MMKEQMAHGSARLYTYGQPAFATATLFTKSSHAFSSPITFLANFECSRPKYESATAAKTLEAEAQLK